MVIGYFHISWAVFGSYKTDSVLFVDADTVLPVSVTGKWLKVIAGRLSQLIKAVYGIRAKPVGFLCLYSPGA